MKWCDGPAVLEEVFFICFNCNKKKEEAHRVWHQLTADRLQPTCSSVQVTSRLIRTRLVSHHCSPSRRGAKARNTAEDGCPHMPKKKHPPTTSPPLFPITDHAQTSRVIVSNLRSSAGTARAHFTKRWRAAYSDIQKCERRETFFLPPDVNSSWWFERVEARRTSGSQNHQVRDLQPTSRLPEEVLSK